MSDDADPVVTLRGPDGDTKSVPLSRVAAFAQQGYKEETESQAAQRVGKEARESQIGAVESFGQAAGRTLSLGGTDALQRALAPDTAATYLRDAQSAHPTADTLGTVAGVVVPLAVGDVAALAPLSQASKLGRAAASLGEGGSTLARVGGGIFGGAVEGGAIGLGQGVSELAMSSDPLTAEHVASVLGSSVLLGAGTGGAIGGGSKLLERGFEIAGEKLASVRDARAAASGLPEDLQKLDDKGLAAAHKTAVAEHAADIQAEKASLEEIRVNQRAEMANRVKELHEDLATERPIFSALSENEALNPALKGIEGVGDARVQLAKSYSRIRSGLDSPLSVERNPSTMIGALEQRQGALETLQAKMPELHTALAGDARAEVLQHVDTALAETKQQIAAIRQLGKETPVASGRLTALESNPSARMTQIADARDALKNAPELGLVGKGVKAAAFGGITAVAHAIPGMGIAAPFIGHAASEAVGKLFARASTATGEGIAKTAGAVKSFLDRAAPVAARVKPVATATAVLAAAKFAAGPEPKSKSLGDLYNARAQEIRSQTMLAPDGSTVMRPEARQAVADRLKPIAAVNPVLADKLETIQARKTTYLSQTAPKKPDVQGLQIGPDSWQPPDLAMRAWARRVLAVDNPHLVEQRLARGVCTPEEAEAYRAVYPEKHAQLCEQIAEAASAPNAKKIPMAKHVALTIFTGQPTTPALAPNILAVYQGNFATEHGSKGGTSAPQPMPSFGALGSMKSYDKPTPGQAHTTE